MKYSLHVTAWGSKDCDKRKLESGAVATFVTGGAEVNDTIADVGRSKLTLDNITPSSLEWKASRLINLDRADDVSSNGSAV
jgi:hypothetical protein